MSIPIRADLDMGSVARITNLPAPVASGDAANRGYVDSAIEGLAWKDNVRVATQANVNLAAPGATIDGVTMALSDRVLVRAQTTGAQNGLYIWNGASTPMTRSADANTAEELEQAVVSVDEGASASATFRQTAVNFTLDSGAVTWASFGTAAPAASESAAGVAEIATQAETNAGSDDARFVTPAKLAGWTGRARRYAADIGDGSATSYIVTHNLGTEDVQVQVRETGGSKRVVIPEVQVTSANAVTILLAAAPAAGAYRVIVQG